jgi:hypothetical protein
MMVALEVRSRVLRVVAALAAAVLPSKAVLGRSAPKPLRVTYYFLAG